MKRLASFADKLITFSFYSLLFAVPLVFSPWNFELFEMPKMLLTYLLTVIILASWAIKSAVLGKPILRRTILDIPLLLLFFAHLLSTLYSIDPHTSIWGYYTRSHGGLLSTIAYMLLYWAFVSNMDRRRTLSSIFYLLSSATVVAIWSIFEHFGISPSCIMLRGQFNAECWVQDVQTRVFATLGQPNWMAAWLVAIMPLTWAIALNLKVKTQRLKSKNWRSKLQLKSKKFWLWIAISGLFLLALLFTKSRSGLLGFMGAYTVFWGLVLYTKRFFAVFALLSTYLLIIVLFVGTAWTPSLSEAIFRPILAPPQQAVETGTVLETGGTESGEIRKIVWKGALDAWRAYPLFGSGVETFAYVYYNFRPVEHNYTSEWDFLYNKAHNEYLNFAATTGTIGLGAYLLLIGTVIWFFTKSIKEEVINNKSEKLIPNTYYLRLSLASGYSSILVTNFFGFSVVPVALLFFLYPATSFALTTPRQKAVRLTTHQSLTTTPHSLPILFVLLFTVYGLLTVGRIWSADVYYARANNQINQGQVGEGIKNAQQALHLRPDEPNYWNELAQGYGLLAASLALNNKKEEAKPFANKAVEAVERATSISAHNLTLLKSRAVIFTQLAAVDEKYLFAAIQALEKARTLAPTEPKIHYNLGVLYSRVQDKEQAIKLLEKALELKSDYQDPKEALEALRGT